VTYTPAAGFTGPDTFAFTVSDGQGGTGTGHVNVTVLSTDGPTPNMHPPRVDQNGNYVIGFSGLPGSSYLVQRAPSVTGPWTTLATVVVGPSGVAEYVDTDPNRPNPVFYRAILP